MQGLRAERSFVFVRHGESEGNREGRMQGHLDLPLTAEGRRQAREAGRWFAAQHIRAARIFTSPLSRAAETAQLIAETASFPNPHPLESVKELDTGRFTGLTFAEIQAQYPQLYAQFKVRSWEVVPEAERVNTLVERALDAWEFLVTEANRIDKAEDSSGSALPLITVTHGGMIQWIIKTSFGATQTQPHAWLPLVLASNCGIFWYNARPVRGQDHSGCALDGYYGQWSLMNHTADRAVSHADQFHTRTAAR